MSNEKDNLLILDNRTDLYLNKANEKAEQGDFVSSLGFLFSALKIDYSCDILSEIAFVYADMSLWQYSNEYWFKYLRIAPEDKKVFAYGQLAKNFYCLDNYGLSAYYFYLKYGNDSSSMDDAESEMYGNIVALIKEKDIYYIAYPYDRADYSHLIKIAKRLFACGNYANAESMYKNIPRECWDEDVVGELATALFLQKKDKEVVEVCNYSLNKFGENVTAYCNLSSLFFAQKNKDKSAYYYSQALKVKNDSVEQAYKLVVCAMEQNDDLTVNELLKNILSDGESDFNLRFFYGVSQANIGDLEGAKNTFSEIYRIVPNDKIAKFYATYLCRFTERKEEKNYLPFSYKKELPLEITKNYKRIINDLFSNRRAINSKNSEKYMEILEWGIEQEATDYAKRSVCILSTITALWAEELFFDSLMNSSVDSQIKQMIIGLVILSGYKQSFPLLADGMYITVKPQKFAFENKTDGDLYMAAYAISLSRMAFWSIENFEKVGIYINKLYKKLKLKVVEYGFTPEEISAAAIYNCHFLRLSDIKTICRIMGVKTYKVKELLNIYSGENYDKNN